MSLAKIVIPRGMELVIFDVDGVLVDSEAISCEALRFTIQAECGVDIGDDFSSVIGKSNQDALRYYLDIHQIQYDDELIEFIAKKKGENYIKMAKESLKTFPGCREALVSLQHKGMKMVVASSGSIKKIRFSLNEVGILSFFEQINSVDQVSRGKPYPDLFLHAAQGMNIPPDKCVVIEDSLLGIRAAKSAGMQVLAFTSSYSQAEFFDLGVPVFDRFDQLM